MEDQRAGFGVERRTAYALAVFPLDIVHRRTIRAMLPVGQTGGVRSTNQRLRRSRGNSAGHNRTSVHYQDALRKFARQNWIDRGQEFIRIRERGALLDFALHDLTTVPAHALHLHAAIEAVRAELAKEGQSAASVQQRRNELLAVQRLMNSAIQGKKWSGKHSVEFINKGRAF